MNPDHNTRIRQAYPKGCRVSFYRNIQWPTARVVGYRVFAHGYQTLVVEMEADSQPLRWEGEVLHDWQAGNVVQLTNGEMASVGRMPEPQAEMAV